MYMRILLIGEYSRLHNSLKEGLQELGHEVVLVGDGDAFKNYPIDISINNQFTKKYLPLILRKLSKRVLNIDPSDLETYYKFKKILPQLTDFDVVQLINEDALKIKPQLQIKLLKQLFEQNKNSYLLCCGQDHVSISYALEQKIRYSIMTPYLNDKNLKDKYHYSLKYVTQPYQKLHQFIRSQIKGVIASDLDYHIPYSEQSNYLGLIPNAINTKKLQFSEPQLNIPIHIFHGVNSKSKIKKGNTFFTEALEIIKAKYGEKIKITSSCDVPYKEYITSYTRCHILLDQVYSFDQGYNALEAMAMGKVVFTGAEKEWLDYYNLKEDTVAINALPNVTYLVEKLEWLIDNPENIITISKNARQFVETHHDYKKVSRTYLEFWNRET